MENNIKAARLLVEEMSASDAEAFLKWLQKQVPQKIEAETPTLSSAALWWLAKLKSGNVLPDGGWPTMLPVDDLGSDYINAMTPQAGGLDHQDRSGCLRSRCSLSQVAGVPRSDHRRRRRARWIGWWPEAPSSL